MKKAIEEAVADQFEVLLQAISDSQRSKLTEICDLQKELSETLSEEQQKLYCKIDDLIVETETEGKDTMFRYGIYEGVKLGGMLTEISIPESPKTVYYEVQQELNKKERVS